MKNKKEIFFTILFVKIAIFLLIFLAFYLLPFGARYYYANFRYPVKSPVTLLTAYTTWDAQHYAYVSEKGYKKNIDSDAFPPLFPFMIYILTFITRNNYISGLLLANIFSFIGFFIFYYLVRTRYSEKIAWRSLLFLLAFPTSFYFSLMYTESLFFLLVMLFFLFLQKRKLFFASIAAFLLPMTRLIGVVIVIPFAFAYILEYQSHSLYEQVAAIGKSLLQKKTLLVLSPFVGLAFVMCLFYITTGNFFTIFTVQQNFVSHYSFFSIFDPLFFLKALFTFPLQIHGFTNSIIDRLFFLSFISLFFFLYKRVSFPYFVYALCFGLLPVLSGSFMSYTRYLLIVFPLFITFAAMSTEKKYKNFLFPFLFACIMLQTLFIIMHSLNYWVA